MPFPNSAGSGPQQLDGPPPSPVTSPPAASEASKMGMLTGGAGPGQPGGPAPSGGGTSGPPDLSGIMMLGQKLDEGILALAEALPAQAALFGQCSEILKNAIAQALQSQPSGGASRGGMAPAGAQAQAGNQFPGGGFSAGRTA